MKKTKPAERSPTDRKPYVLPSVKRLTAAELIAEKGRDKCKTPLPPPEAMAELERVIEHNDAQTQPRTRVSGAAAVRMLRSYGWSGGGSESLNKLCAEVYGRKSFGSP